MSTDNSHPDSVLLFTRTLELLQIHKTHPGLILMYNMVINMVCINMIHYISKETRFSRHVHHFSFISPCSTTEVYRTSRVHHFSFISPCSTTEVYRTSRLPRPTGKETFSWSVSDRTLILQLEHSGRASDSRLRGSGLNPVLPCETLHCSSSLRCINEYVAIDIGGCVRAAFAH